MLDFIKSISFYGVSIGLALLLIMYTPTPICASRNTKEGTHVFVLTQGIYLDWYYYSLLDALASAERGQKIKIILKSNPGGLIPTMTKLLAGMRDTQATVITEVQGYGSSCALDILFSGDIIIVPKSTLLEGNALGVAHLSSNDKGNDFWLITELIHLKPFMTSQEWDSFTTDGDVTLYGKTICNVAPHKIRDAPEYCVLGGEMR